MKKIRALFSRRSAIIATALFFIGAVAYGFPDSPSPWFDEGINLGIAKTFVETGVYSLGLGGASYVDNRPLMISTNYPVLGPISLAFYFFGFSLAAAKAVMISFLGAFLLLAFITVRRLSGEKAAVAAIALVVTFLPFYGNGLSGGLGEVPGLVYLLAALLFLERETKTHWLLTGFLFGLCFASKVFYLVVALPVAMAELWGAYQTRTIPWRRWLFMIIGALPPLVLWIWTLFPDGFGVGLMGAATYYGNPYNLSQSTVLKNILSFFKDATLIHFLLLAITYSGYVFILYKERAITKATIIIGLFTALDLLYFLRSPGWFRYLFPVHLLLLMVFPAAFGRIMSRIVGIFKYATWCWVVVVTLLAVVQAGHFIRQRSKRLYYNPEPRQFAEWVAKHVPTLETVYLVDHPELWFLLPGTLTNQYIHMNPYIAFGHDFRADAVWPDYLVVQNPRTFFASEDQWQRFEKEYMLEKQHGRYILYKKLKP